MKSLTSNYLYQSLNESLNDCPSLLMIYQLNKSVFDRLFKATLKKGFTFTKLKENDIVKLTPAEAFKYGGKEGDKYIKLWLTSKKEVGIVTWANTMIDDNFNWNAKARGPDKRNNSKLIGIPTMCQGYLKKTDYLFSTFTRCYMIPFEKLGNYKSFKAKEQQKTKNSLSGVTIQHISPAEEEKMYADAAKATQEHNAKAPASIKLRDSNLINELIQAGKKLIGFDFNTVHWGHGLGTPMIEADRLPISIETTCYVTSDAEEVVNKLYPTIKKLGKKFGFNYIERNPAREGVIGYKCVWITFKKELTDRDIKYNGWRYKIDKL